MDTDRNFLVEINSPTHVPLFDSPDNSSAGALRSSVSGPQDASSCGTVVRPNKRHPYRSPPSVIELHENGIFFDHIPGGQQRDDEDAESLQEQAQSMGETSQKERHITFASPATAPATPRPRLIAPVGSLSPDQLKELDFHSHRPPDDPREERRRETKTLNSGTKDRDKDTYGVLSGRQCSDRSSWILKRALRSNPSEECPFRTRLLKDQIQLSGDSALVENRLPQAYTAKGAQTQELFAEENWNMAPSAIKNTSCPETTPRSGFANKEHPGTLLSSMNRDLATSIHDLPSMSPVRDSVQGQSMMIVSLEGKGDAGVTEPSREDGPRRMMTAYLQNMSSETVEGSAEMVPQEAAGKRMSPVGSASSATAGSDNLPRRDSTDKDQRVANGHVQGALERLRKSETWNANLNSRMPPALRSSSNSPIHQADTQGRGFTPMAQRPRRLTKKQKLERAVDELLTERCVAPTSTFTSARQASRITASEMMDTAAWNIHFSVVNLEEGEQRRTSQQPGNHGGDGEGGTARTRGGLREKAVLAVAHVMVLSVKMMRLYRNSLCSCLNPRSKLWDQVHNGAITPLEAIATIITVWMTFYISFGLYTAFLCFRNVLQSIWQADMYDY